MADRLAAASGPTHFLLPRDGVEEWDRPGQAAHDPEGLAAFVDETETALKGRVSYQTLNCHINDEEFGAAALSHFDGWVAQGIVPPGKPA